MTDVKSQTEAEDSVYHMNENTANANPQSLLAYTVAEQTFDEFHAHAFVSYPSIHSTNSPPAATQPLIPPDKITLCISVSPCSEM